MNINDKKINQSGASKNVFFDICCFRDGNLSKEKIERFLKIYKKETYKFLFSETFNESYAANNRNDFNIISEILHWGSFPSEGIMYAVIPDSKKELLENFLKEGNEELPSDVYEWWKKLKECKIVSFTSFLNEDFRN